MIARQALSPGTFLQRWSDSIIDAAADRRLRVRRQIGSTEVIFAVPKTDESIGTFVFAVICGHGYNIMTGASSDSASQQEIANVLATLQFVDSSD